MSIKCPECGGKVEFVNRRFGYLCSDCYEKAPDYWENKMSDEKSWQAGGPLDYPPPRRTPDRIIKYTFGDVFQMEGYYGKVEAFNLGTDEVVIKWYKDRRKK